MIFGRVSDCEPGQSVITKHYVIVTYEHGDIIPNIGDKIWLGGRMYEIRGIEMRKQLMDPPMVSKDVIFRLKDVLDE